MTEANKPHHFSNIFREINELNAIILHEGQTPSLLEQLQELKEFAADFREGLHRPYITARVIERGPNESTTVVTGTPVDAQETLASEYYCVCGLTYTWEGPDEIPVDVWDALPGHRSADEIQQ